MRCRFALLGLVAFLAGCFPSTKYLKAELDTVQKVGAKYLAYVAADPAMQVVDPQNGKTGLEVRQAWVAGWLDRISEGEVDPQADLAIYNLIAAQYEAYLDGDTTLSKTQRSVFKFKLKTWKLRIDTALER